MAKEGKKFNKKLALTVAIPALVMAVIIAVIGVSFAWFTDSVTAEIATINLSVAEMFVMDFKLDNTPKTNNATQKDYIYSGQIGYDSNGNLITDTANNDKAFVAPFDMRLDTGNFSANFTCSIIKVRIHNGKPDNVNEIYVDESVVDSTLTVEDIPLGFTWYIAGTDPRDSKYYWYTPYGTYQVDSAVGVPAEGTFGSLNLTAKVENLNFVAVANKESAESFNYTFNIVFAPEKLFWDQYKAGEALSATEIYGNSSVDGGFKSTKWNALNKYSSQVYSGYTFEFKVLLEVSSATRLQGGNE